MTDPYYDLFISHAEADRAWVEGYLLDALDRAGVRHHREAAFALGVPRIVEFENAVKDSRRILLVLSPAYFANDTARFVDLLAQTFGLETSTWPVIPLVLEPAALPTRLSMLTMLEATTPEDREEALRKLCVLFQRPLPAPPARPPCPYPGMRPFALDRDGQPTYPFFGRDRETDRLLQALRKNRFLTVIGSSGSGKSSLVLAGLVPRLRASGFFGPGGWRILVMRPTDEPFAELRKALDADPADPPAAAAHALAAQPDARHLLLMVDQFEELFTVAEGDTRVFQQALVRLAEVPDAHVVLTVRADFYDDLMASPLWPAIQRNRAEIAPLDEAGLREAIHKPAEAVGVYVEPALVERLAADAAGSPGVLPLVQETLVLLWEKLERRVLPLRSYQSLILTRSAYTIPHGEGYRTGLDVAIAQHAESVIAAFEGTPRAEIARRIFLRLIQFGEGRPNTRRQQTVAQLRAGHDPVEFAQVLKHLTDNRLLTQSGDEQTGRRKADVAHEALIVGWPRFREWISEHRAAEEIRRELEAKASAWIAKGRGDAGLLDRVDLPLAGQWLAGPDGCDLAGADPIRDLIRASHAAIEEAERRHQAVQQRELDDARALADERKRRLETARRWAVGMVAALVILAGALVLAGLQTRWAKESETRAVAAKKEADEAKQAAEKQAKVATSQRLAALSVSERDKAWDRSLILAAEALQPESTFEARANFFKCFNERPGLMAILRFGPGLLTSIAISPDGKTIAGAYQLLNGGGVALWDGTSHQPLAGSPFGEENANFTCLAFSPDGESLAAGYQHVNGSGGGVVLWDVTGRKQLAERPLAVEDGGVTTVAFSPDGKSVAAAYRHRFGVVPGGVIIWRASGRHWLPQPPLRIDRDEHDTVELSADLKNVVVGYSSSDGGEGAVSFWERSGLDWHQHGPTTIKEGGVSAVAFSPDGRTVATGCKAGVILWNVASRTRLTVSPLDVAASTRKRLTGSRNAGKVGGILSVAFSPDGRRICAIFVLDEVNGALVLWDSASREQKLVIPLASKRMTLIPGWALSPGGNPTDRIVRDDADLTLIPGWVALSPDGNTIAAEFPDGVGLWDVSGQEWLSEEPLATDIGEVLIVAFSPDGQYLAAGFQDGVGLWDAKARKRLTEQPLAVKGGPVRRLAFTADLKSITAGYSTDYKDDVAGLMSWGLTSHQPVEVDMAAVKAWHSSKEAFSPDGKTITAITCKSVSIVSEFPDLTGTGNSSERSCSLVVRDVASHRLIWESHPTETRGDYSSVALSPDGKTLAAGCGGGVELWDTAARKRLSDLPLKVKGGPVSSVTFSPDGKTIAAGYGKNGKGGIVLFDVDRESWTRKAGSVANRNLTRDEWLEYFPEDPYRATFSSLPIPPEVPSQEPQARR